MINKTGQERASYDMRTPGWVCTEYPDEYLTIEQAAKLMTRLGLKTSASTLRQRRKAWLRGDRQGPTPLLVSARCLRYERSNVVETVQACLDAAKRSATG